MNTPKQLVLPWQRMVSFGLKHASMHPIITRNCITPWEYLMHTWIESLTRGSFDPSTVYHSQSDWAIVCRGIVNYSMSQKKQSPCTRFDKYQTAVTMLQSQDLSEKQPIWTLKDFLTLVKLASPTIDLHEKSMQLIASSWNEPPIAISDIPDVQELLNPKFVSFVDNLWGLQGHLQNASFLWTQSKIKIPTIDQACVSFDFE